MRRKNTQINSSQDDCWHGYFSFNEGALAATVANFSSKFDGRLRSETLDGRPILSMDKFCPISSSPPVRCVWREQVRYPQTIYPLCFYRKDRFGQNRADVYRKRIRQLCARMRPERKSLHIFRCGGHRSKLIGSQENRLVSNLDCAAGGRSFYSFDIGLLEIVRRTSVVRS